jgi:hypothetical protein
MKPITSAKYDLAPGSLRVIDETDKKDHAPVSHSSVVVEAGK